MAEYYREELSMLEQLLLSYNDDLAKAKSKRELLIAKSNIEVTIEQIIDCYADLVSVTA